MLRWRNWRLPVKLGAVMIVPVLVCLALGIALISTDVAKAGDYARADRMTGLNASMRDAISGLQAERQLAATPQSAGASGAHRTAAWQQVDQALSVARQNIAAEVASGSLDSAAAAEWATVDRQLTELGSVRASQQANQPGSTDASNEVGDYTQLIDSLLAFDRVLATDVSDAQVARDAMALYDVSAAREEVRYQQAVVLAGIGSGVMSVADVTALHGSEARLASRISDFHAVADADVADAYARAVGGPTLANQSTLLGQAIDQSGGMSGMPEPGMMIQVPVTVWNQANDAVVAGLDQVIDDLASQLANTSSSLRQQASDNAGLAAAALIGTLLVAIAVMIVMARQLLRSLGVLRDAARDIAGRQLPATVERIRSGESVDPTVTPVPVSGTDEVGQLARAFDAVHGEARRLAVEQANLRANYTDLFRNLSRRSQGLVQRQLRLIEQLERDEEDPDQLSALFQLDHLATRMRRNNENLMVLSGGDLGRGPGQPIGLTDVLRAAVSEIEQYQRVQVQPPPQAQIVGYAAGDLVRLLAELLDNATAFSAPDTQVTISSHRGRGRAVVIDIVDHGIGMNDAELARANTSLAEAEGVEGRVSRRLGLFVVARLASQHGVRVRLHGGADIPGLRVTVTVPADVVVPEPEPIPTGLGLLTQEPRVAEPPSDSEMTIIIPVVPAVESSGVNLFHPLSDVDGEAGALVAEPVTKPEGTPIYDDMLLSAWFQATKPERSTSRVDGAVPDAATEDEEPVWPAEADEGWRKADAISAMAGSTELTAAGLPKRQPRARLMPGGVSPETGEATEASASPASPTMPVESTVGTPVTPAVPVAPAASAGSAGGRHARDPELVRHRMSGFQRGVRRGRQLAGSATEPAATAPTAPLITEPVVAEPVITEPPEPVAMAAPPTNRSPVGGAAPDAAQHDPTPARSDAAIADALFAETPLVESPFAAASRGESTEPPEPTTLTAAGLPRRQSKAKLLPGSVGTARADDADGADGEPAEGGRDAGMLRDRLNSFQQGIRRGRNGSAVLAAERIVHEAEHEVEWEHE
jgi:signal transduction histidine kinase